MSTRPKVPTDAATVRAFQKYEEAMNVAMAVLRDAPEKVFPGNKAAVGHQMDNLYRGHLAFKYVAHAAQDRIDAKKAGKA